MIRDELAGTFFTMNLDRARAALARVPWVRKVALRRAVAAAARGDDRGARTARALERRDALVNPHGEVFAADYDGELPQLRGRGRARRRSHRAVSRMVERRSRRWGSRVREIRVSPRGGWRLSRRRARRVRSTSSSAATSRPTRLARFVAVYGRTIGALARAGTRVDRVDLRYRNGFAARVPGFREQPAKKTGGRHEGQWGAKDRW